MAPYEPDRGFYRLLGVKPHTASSETIVRQAYLGSGMAFSPPESDASNNISRRE
ncbi:hypothetical protein IMZ48_30015 [Candidatus Bathyarchaeota archaeon]|nr:hypothetical protein [Candidatus Bathyarchaeota archaeon]